METKSFEDIALTDSRSIESHITNVVHELEIVKIKLDQNNLQHYFVEVLNRRGIPYAGNEVDLGVLAQILASELSPEFDGGKHVETYRNWHRDGRFPPIKNGV